MYLFLWRHFETSSDLLFNKDEVSAREIKVFSVRHKSHLLVPHRYGVALAAIDQLSVCWMFFSFSDQINFDNSVSFRYL